MSFRLSWQVELGILLWNRKKHCSQPEPGCDWFVSISCRSRSGRSQSEWQSPCRSQTRRVSHALSALSLGVIWRCEQSSQILFLNVMGMYLPFLTPCTLLQLHPCEYLYSQESFRCGNWRSSICLGLQLTRTRSFVSTWSLSRLLSSNRTFLFCTP